MFSKYAISIPITGSLHLFLFLPGISSPRHLQGLLPPCKQVSVQISLSHCFIVQPPCFNFFNPVLFIPGYLALFNIISMYVQFFLSSASPLCVSFTLVGIYVPCSLLHPQCLDQWLVYISYLLNICWIHDEYNFAFCSFQKYIWPTYIHSSIRQPFNTWRQALYPL